MGFALFWSLLRVTGGTQRLWGWHGRRERKVFFGAELPYASNMSGSFLGQWMKVAAKDKPFAVVLCLWYERMSVGVRLCLSFSFSLGVGLTTSLAKPQTLMGANTFAPFHGQWTKNANSAWEVQIQLRVGIFKTEDLFCASFFSVNQTTSKNEGWSMTDQNDQRAVVIRLTKYGSLWLNLGGHYCQLLNITQSEISMFIFVLVPWELHAQRGEQKGETCWKLFIWWCAVDVFLTCFVSSVHVELLNLVQIKRFCKSSWLLRVWTDLLPLSSRCFRRQNLTHLHCLSHPWNSVAPVLVLEYSLTFDGHQRAH